MARAVYLLDANVFMEAARRYYAFDLHTRFWDILSQHAEDGVIESLDRVKSELDKTKDELASWAEANFARAFCSTDSEDITESYAKVMTWVQGQPQFSGAAKVADLGLQDAWAELSGQ